MRVRPFYIILIACMISAYVDAQSNEGRSFWFGFMEHVDDGRNTMVAMISSKVNTSGTISAPALGFSASFMVTPEEVTLINLPTKAEVIGSESITNKGLHVEASDPISLFIHQYANNRSEASLVLPTASLGDEYYIMSYPGIKFNNSADNYSEFLIVATEDDTEVEINLSDGTLRGRSAGETLSIRLNQGQTYQVQARTTTGDMTGTYVTASKRISVFGGSEWSQVPIGCTFMDNLMEQMYPVTTWGAKYITIPSIQVNSDLYRILAARNNTTIELKTSTEVRTINLDAGEYEEYLLQGEAAEIEANNPIMVAQYNIGSSCSGYPIGDPSMLLVNPIEQSRDTVTLYNSSFQNIFENYISAILKTEDIGITTFDGNPIDQVATRYGSIGDSTFSYFIMTVESGSHTLISPGCGVIASAYGYGDAESYSYGGGANFRNSQENPLPDGGCLNDTVFFDSGLSPFRYDVSWDYGDGQSGFGVETTHIYDKLGTYLVTMDYTDKCLNVSDSKQKELLITLRKMVNAPDSIEICQYDNLELSASDIDGASYLWTGPDGYRNEAQFPLIDSIQLSNQGNYEVIGIISGCATFPAFTFLTVDPAPIPALDIDTVFCSRQNSVTLNPGNFSSYRWSTGESTESIQVIEENIYSVTVTDSIGCPGETSIILQDVCPSEIFVPNIFSPNQDGVNDEFIITTFQVESYTIKIFDRWGNQVYQGRENSPPWNGQNDQVSNEIGVYTYVIEYIGMDVKGNLGSFYYSGDVALIK